MTNLEVGTPIQVYLWGAKRMARAETPDEGSNNPGLTLAGRYELGETLGEGNMGTVYKAHDTLLNRYVAIKTIPPHDPTSTIPSTRFFREAQSLARLSQGYGDRLLRLDSNCGVCFDQRSKHCRYRYRSVGTSSRHTIYDRS